MNTERVATADVSEWQSMRSVPYGAKCLLLTPGLVAVIGSYTPGANYLAWAPLPKIPQWLRCQIEEQYHRDRAGGAKDSNPQAEGSSPSPGSAFMAEF